MQALISVIESGSIPGNSNFLSLLDKTLAREDKNFHITLSTFVSEKLILGTLSLVEWFEDSGETSIVRMLLVLLRRVLESHEEWLDEKLFSRVKGIQTFQKNPIILHLYNLTHSYISATFSCDLMEICL